MGIFKKKIKNFIRFLKQKELVPVATPIDSNKLLEGKIALITGGSSGIGYAIANEFIKNATPNSHEVAIDEEFIDENGIIHPIKEKENAILTPEDSDEYKHHIETYGPHKDFGYLTGSVSLNA